VYGADSLTQPVLWPKPGILPQPLRLISVSDPSAGIWHYAILAGMIMRRYRFSFLVRVVPAALLVLSSLAATAAREDDRERRDAVRRAVESGDALPLSQILPKLRGRVAGDITGVEVEREHGHWHYEFRVIARDGRVFDVHVDAHSGEIERIEEK